MSNVRTHVVLRPFQAEGREVLVGEAVDASAWKNTERLVTTKYLRPMNEADYATTSSRSKPATKPTTGKKFFLKKRSS